MLAAAVLTAAVATAAPTLPKSERDLVREAIAQRYGPKTQVFSILTKSGYALAQGQNFHDGLHKSGGKWRITCSNLPSGQITPAMLQSKCQFPQTVALLVSTEEPVDIAAGQGDFRSAAALEKQAYASATGPQRDVDRVRMQQLNLLNEQMRTQTITRSQAIQQWSQAQFSWSLP